MVDTVTLPRMGSISSAVMKRMTATGRHDFTGVTSTRSMVTRIIHHTSTPTARNPTAPASACHHATEAMAAEGEVAK